MAFDWGTGAAGAEMRLTGSIDPSAVGIVAPIGTSYVRNNAGTGEFWVKYAAASNAWRKASILNPTVTFDQSANLTTLTTIPADVNLGVLVLLSEVITANGTLQTAVNNCLHLITQIVDVLQAHGMAN